MFKDNAIDERWIEIQFYTICIDLLKLRDNLMDVMDMIDNLVIFGTYSPEQIKVLAQEAITSLQFRPTREEFCILAYIQGVPIKEIKQRTGFHNNTLYKLIHEEKRNPRLFYTRVTDEKRALLKKFVDTFNTFKKVGVSCS